VVSARRRVGAASAVRGYGGRRLGGGPAGALLPLAAVGRQEGGDGQCQQGGGRTDAHDDAESVLGGDVHRAQADAHLGEDTLLEEIGGSPVPHTEFVFAPELVVRGSTAQAPA
jgi:hypothetical protein